MGLQTSSFLSKIFKLLLAATTKNQETEWVSTQKVSDLLAIFLKVKSKNNNTCILGTFLHILSYSVTITLLSSYFTKTFSRQA